MGRTSTIANFVLAIAPFIIGFVIAVLLSFATQAPRGTAISALGAYGIGFILFAIAKASVLRSDKFLSWGARAMQPIYRACYFVGYTVMGIGLMLTLVLAAVR